MHRLFLVSTLALVFGAAPAQAQLTSDEQKCISGLNSKGAGVAKAQGKLNGSCIKTLASGKVDKLGADTADQCIGADPKGKVAKAQAKTDKAAGKSCDPAMPPAYGFAGAEAINQAATTETAALAGDLLGFFVDDAIVRKSDDKTGAACQGEILKRTTKLTDTLFKAATKSQKNALATASNADELAAAFAAAANDPKATKAADKLQSGAEKKCGGVDLAAAFPACNAATTDELGSCATGAARCRFCRSLASGSDLPLDCDTLDDAAANGSCLPAGAPSVSIVQEVEQIPGHVEPHTPGSGALEEIATAQPIIDLLGPAPDLNHVSYIRTYTDDATAREVILVMIPGFLGGGSTYDPLARDLVQAHGASLEVWAVDRRPNQLEDRLGAIHAFDGAQDPDCVTSPPADTCAIFEGAQFYFPDLDRTPTGDFPGPGDLDLNLNGVFDDQIDLDDGDGLRPPALMAQDDLRFMAYWGLDTYFRDWKLLVEAARAVVGPDGLVLIGGHSQGTGWSSTFVAYDFDPDPAVVVAGHSLVDGLILLEGGGVGPGAETKPTLAEYEATVLDLETPGGPDVFLEDFSGIPLQALGTSGEVASIAGFFQPDEPALIQRTPTFGAGLIAALLQASATNQALGGMFLDDDLSGIGAFRASMGFIDDGPMLLQEAGPLFSDEFYIVQDAPGRLRTWRSFDDPTLPTCPPRAFDLSDGESGCAIIDNGPPSDPAQPSSVEPPRLNGVEAEVSSLDDFFLTQFGKANGFEWYFSSSRPSLDFSYGNDSSALVAEHLLVDANDEGPLVVTQNANVDIPVICFGGSNGLTPEPKSFDRYLSSIATPPAQQEVHILEGHAHLDPLTARANPTVGLLETWIQGLLSN